MRSSASCFSFQYPLVCLRSSTSCLLLLPRPLATSFLLPFLPSFAPSSVKRVTRQFLRNFQYPLVYLRSSTSCLLLLPRLLVKSFLLSFAPSSIKRVRRQFLRKMWPIQLAFLLFSLFWLYIGYLSTPGLSIRTVCLINLHESQIKFIDIHRKNSSHVIFSRPSDY